MKSLRIRLSVLLLLAAIATAAVIGVITYRHTLEQNEKLFDYQLRQIALSLRDQGAVQVPLLPYAGAEENSDLVVQIWTSNGIVLYMSRPDGPLLNRAVLGFADVDAAHQRWRVYSMLARDRIIQVAQPLDLRRDLAAAAALRSLTPLLAFAPLMALLIWWSVGTSLSSLRRLAGEVGRQDARTLKQVSEDDVPTEVVPLIHALNSLLARLKRAFAHQRAFVADAAHELRSPLTALSLQLQLLTRAPDEAAKAAALANLREGFQRATHLVDQLLTAARTDPNEILVELRPTDLSEQARLAIADVFVFAQERELRIELQAQDGIMIPADGNSLRILLRNLLDNAIRYAPRGGSVLASVRATDQGAMLCVEDSGPGIPADDRQRVFDRFCRRETGDQSGSGLGLSIVRNIAEQHGAQVSLDQSAALGGLKACVDFHR